MPPQKPSRAWAFLARCIDFERNALFIESLNDALCISRLKTAQGLVTRMFGSVFLFFAGFGQPEHLTRYIWNFSVIFYGIIPSIRLLAWGASDKSGNIGNWF